MPDSFPSDTPDLCAIFEAIGASIRAEVHAIAHKISGAFDHSLVKRVYVMDRDNGYCLLECTKAFVVYYEKFRDNKGVLRSKVAPFLVSSGILGANWTASTNLAIVVEWQANCDDEMSRRRTAFENEIVLPPVSDSNGEKSEGDAQLDAWFTPQVTGGDWYHASTGVTEDISRQVLLAAGPTHNFGHCPLLRVEDIVADRIMEEGDDIGIFDSLSGPVCSQRHKRGCRVSMGI